MAKAKTVINDTAGGAVAGAAIGSVVPGIGTGIGALVGGGIGLLGGLFGGDDSTAPPMYTPQTPQMGSPSYSVSVDNAGLEKGVVQWMTDNPGGDANAWIAANTAKYTTYINLATGQTLAPGEVPKPGTVVQGQDGALQQVGQGGSLSAAPNYNGYQLGANFGMTPAGLFNNVASVGLVDQNMLLNAGNNAQATLGNASASAFNSGNQILNNAMGVAGNEQLLGQQGLGQGQALLDYNNALGQYGLSSMTALGNQANQASAYYGGQQASLLGNQMDLQNATFNALGGINQQAQGAIGALNTSAANANQTASGYQNLSNYYGQQAANTGAGAVDAFGQLRNVGAQANANLSNIGAGALNTSNYYGNQAAGFGAAATGSQNTAAQGYGALAQQGEQNQAYLNSAASGVENITGQNASALAREGMGNQAGLSQLGSVANANASYYGNQGAQNLGYSGTDRQSALGAVGRLQNFYQQGPGPSAAEAQLRQSEDTNMSQAIALARSGRSAGDEANNLRQAMFSNAATEQQTGMQLAQLRAQEAANWRGQQLSAMSTEQGTLGALRGQDIGAATALGGLGQQYSALGGNLYGEGAQLGQSAIAGAGQLTQAGLQLGQGYRTTGAQLGQGATEAAAQGFQGLGAQQVQAMQATGQLGLGYGQLGENAYTSGATIDANAQNAAGQGLTSLTGQNLSAMGTTGNLGLGYSTLGSQDTLGAGNLGIAAGNLTTGALGALGNQNVSLTNQAGQLGLGYGQLGQSYDQSGLNSAAAFGQIGQSALASGLGFAQGMYGASNTAMGNGQNAFTALSGQGNQLLSNATGVGMQTAGALTNIDQYTVGTQLQMAQSQLQSYVSMYGADRGVAIAQMQAQATGDAALLSAAGSFGASLISNNRTAPASSA